MGASNLLIPLPRHLNPAAFAPFGVVVRPVQHPAAIVPHVFAFDRDGIALCYRNARREVDIVRHQQGDVGGDFHQKALVLAAVAVVFEQFDDFALYRCPKLGIGIAAGLADLFHSLRG